MSDWREVDIKVVIDDPDADPPKFHLECDELPRKKGTDDFTFSNTGHPGFLLHYILEGDACGYRFPDDKHQAMYSAKGAGCPKKPGQWGQFKVKEVKSGNKILVVRNLNEKESQGEFGYTLRVTKTPHSSDPKFIELDPGGINTNGPRTLSRSYAAVAVTVIGVVILAGFALRMLAR